MSLVVPLLLLLLSIPLVVGLLRINELFLLEQKDGELRLLRGRIPPGLLRELADVLRTADVASLKLRGVSEEGRARLYAHDGELPRHVAQRLRNTISLWPLAKIRNAPRGR